MLVIFNNFKIIQAPNLLAETWLMHGFGVKDLPIKKYLDALDMQLPQIPETKQVHGNKVHLLSKKSVGLLEGDAFVTDQPGMVCFVRSADCVPILIADCKNRAVAAIHAGWRGTVARVVEETLQVMARQWRTKSKDCKVAIGPAIGGCCYTVGMDVVKELEQAQLFPGPWVHQGSPGKWYLDLAYANQHCLEEWGVPHEQIYLSLACTSCDLEKFHSYRKEKDTKGRQMNFIYIKT